MSCTARVICSRGPGLIAAVPTGLRQAGLCDPSDALAAVNHNARRYLLYLCINQNAVRDVRIVTGVLAHRAAHLFRRARHVLDVQRQRDALRGHELHLPHRLTAEQSLRRRLGCARGTAARRVAERQLF